ncbi:hypothetical protein [Mycobacteroides abscessus]|uniref:hypothetical protein n=1 Tax=Mycobacteroides abscessus TaxID=36809 RepID=UPI0009CBFA5C|nr:hypothetical protein [Mycobacteroides abscessus]SKZ61160.1 Uncharacterised protein [Mycobacteroides abscessus subsp. abscessus]
MTIHQIIDARITSRADRLAPERCQQCRYKGASLAPNHTGQLTCSLCDPTGRDVPEVLERTAS